MPRGRVKKDSLTTKNTANNGDTQASDKENTGDNIVLNGFDLDAVLCMGNKDMPEYAVGTDKYCMALFKLVTRKKRETKDAYYDYECIGYYGSLYALLQGFLKDNIKETVCKEKIVEMKSIVEVIEKANKAIEDAYGGISLQHTTTQ